MRSGQTRLILAALVVVVFWGVVYWSAPASREPAVRVAGADQGPVEPRVALRAPARSGFDTNRPAPPLGRDPEPIASLASVSQDRPVPTSTSDSQPPARSGVLAPQFREVVVQPGQTLMSIAKQIYGDSKKWEAISRANPRLDPLRVKPGMTLRVPVDPKNIQGKQVDPAGEAQPSLARKQETAAPTRASQASPAEYVVREGDTLGAIAGRLLGSSAAWQAILDANRSLLREPEDLRPGMRLTIPASPR